MVWYIGVSTVIFFTQRLNRLKPPFKSESDPPETSMPKSGFEPSNIFPVNRALTTRQTDERLLLESQITQENIFCDMVVQDAKVFTRFKYVDFALCKVLF